MDYTSYGVGTSVVCSTGLGNAKASTRGTDDGTVHAFLVPIVMMFIITICKYKAYEISICSIECSINIIHVCRVLA